VIHDHATTYDVGPRNEHLVPQMRHVSAQPEQYDQINRGRQKDKICARTEAANEMEPRELPAARNISDEQRTNSLERAAHNIVAATDD